MAQKLSVPRYPDSTVILARALVESAQRLGKPVRDPRVFTAALQPLSDVDESRQGEHTPWSD